MKFDPTKFERSLPYASELSGVYQPLLGWRSASRQQRIHDGVRDVRRHYLSDLSGRFRARYDLQSGGDPVEAQFSVHRADLTSATRSIISPAVSSIVATHVAQLIGERDPRDPSPWMEFTRPEVLDKLLSDFRPEILAEYRSRLQTVESGDRVAALDRTRVLQQILERESIAAGVLAHLNSTGDPRQVQTMLSAAGRFHPTVDDFRRFLDDIDPARSDLALAVVAPIGLVHLFRQYFFEFDSFLGPSAQHVWLSPGGTVELIEVSTRKQVVEQTFEQLTDTTRRTETSSTTQDELSDAVRSENSNDTKLGVTATATVGYQAAFVSGTGSVTGTFNAEQNQKQAREQTHKALRQQTEKLSTEIRQSFKSTFRTLTETTDMTSKRYVLQNTTDHLVNYELRRKMRQVGVQVQDYGMQLCWQSFVDVPGDELGVAMLVHVAAPADLSRLKEPDAPVQPDPIVPAPPLSVSVSWPDDDDGNYRGFVPRGTPIKVVPPKPGYVYAGSQVTKVSGEDMYWRARPDTSADTTINFDAGTVTVGPPDIEWIDAGDGTTEPSVKTLWIGFQADGGYSWDSSWDATLQVTLFFRPSQALLKSIKADYEARTTQYNQAKAQVLQQTLFKEAADRVKAAGNVRVRSFAELREEERTVVYRCLIRQLLQVAGITNDNHHIRHVFSELVESLFDVDRMLYFVAPEWWTPRLKPANHQSPQDVGIGTEQTTFNQLDVVTWGGAKASRPDNYYVTEDSAPARLGSSLGWLIQLDGDNLRNAFLNAPWVKAVVPIRAGHELRAINWMSSSYVEGSDGLNDLYAAGSDAERTKILETLKGHTWDDAGLTARYAGLDVSGITILDAIRYLIVVIQGQQAAAVTPTKDKVDPSLTYLPPDTVYEHGFDPLIGGFKAVSQTPYEVFDQWLEVLPTDQIVPVEVKYDPVTGMQIP